MRAIRGLRYNELSSQYENDFALQGALDYRETVMETGFQPVGEYAVHTANSFTEGYYFPPDFRVLRSTNRSTLPIAPFGVRPTTSFGVVPSFWLLTFNGEFEKEDSAPTDVNRLVLKDCTFPILPVSLDFDFDSKLANRILSKFRVLESEIGIILAELHETLSMLLTSVNRVKRGLALIKRGKLRAAMAEYHRITGTAAKTKDFGNAWLEFRYGWTPLFHDVASLYKDYISLSKKVVKLSRVSAGFWEEDTFTRSINVGAAAGIWYPCDIDLSVVRRQRRGYFVLKCDGYARFTGSELVRADSLVDVIELIVNPLSTGWDLVPYSFVADWFINLGDYLRQTGTLYHAYEIIDGYNRYDAAITNIDQPDGFTGRVESFGRSYTRMRDKSLPQIQIELDFTFSSIKHLIDSIFLSTQRIKR